ncbi:MAG TPA: hypothetical protein VL424_18445 [Pararobbsia sp.]|nr:hypothetical protein [Pararobbsia sp.]
MNGSRSAAPVELQRALESADLLEADRLGALLGAALDEVDAQGLPTHVTLADDLARYFIVTPPANSARVHDLRAAASVRFQSLYGDMASGWHLHADWHAAEPFLACAVPRGVTAALEQAVHTRRGCLLSVTPNFVGAWNRSRQSLGANAWLATLDERALTLGLVAATPKPRLASVRTLLLPEPVPPLDWLRDHIARMALLDDVSPPSALFVQGTPVAAWSTDVGAARDSVIASASRKRAAKSRASAAAGAQGEGAVGRHVPAAERGRGPRASSEHGDTAAVPRDSALVVHWIAPGRRAVAGAARRSSRLASFVASLAARLTWGGSAS